MRDSNKCKIVKTYIYTGRQITCRNVKQVKEKIRGM